jgi:hypothetical protein
VRITCSNSFRLEVVLCLRLLEEEAVVMAKVHPSAHMSLEQLARALDDLVQNPSRAAVRRYREPQ